MAYIEFKDIEKSYGDRHILKKINLRIEQGEFVTLLGPSGRGKTTFLRCLAGLTALGGGRIFMDGRDITAVPPRLRNVAMIFQQYNLFPTMTVYSNIAFGLRMKKMPEKTIRHEVAKALEMVGLSGSEKKYPSYLSGGEQQRVALARNLATKPSVLLLDEPFSAIDAKLRKELQIKIKELHNQLNMTSIFVTHDQEEAMRMSDTIHLFNDGRIEQSGRPMELYSRPATAFAASFIGSYNNLSSEDFSRMTGSSVTDSRTIMIRPETITFSQTPFSSEDAEHYYIEGIVSNQIPQGNIIRYTIDVKRAGIDVDLLFHNAVNHPVHQKAYLKISRKNTLFF
ncbi:MAG: ABC transporter ATP-binding protein [Desulfobacter sp.]|nr:MAG: ABC transporter ATP-binding protein [Desulfobacter sp.]